MMRALEQLNYLGALSDEGDLTEVGYTLEIYIYIANSNRLQVIKWLNSQLIRN